MPHSPRFATPAILTAALLLAACESPQTPTVATRQADDPVFDRSGPSGSPTLVYLPEGRSIRGEDLRNIQPVSGTVQASAVVPGVTVSIFYPTGGQTGFGACWMGVQVDAAGNVYPNNGNLWRILPNGVMVDGVGDANFFATGGIGFFFVLDEPAGRLYNAARTSVRSAPFTHGAVYSDFVGGVFEGRGIAKGRGPFAGDLFVSSTFPDRVNKVTLAPLAVSTFSSGAVFHFPEAVASAPDGSVYTNNFSPRSVVKTTAAGVSTTFAVAGPGEFDGRMVAVDNSGNVYWQSGPRIKKYNSSGALLGELPGPPDGSNFLTLMGSAWDSQGNLYVVDNSWCKRIYKISFASVPPNQPPAVDVAFASGVEGSPVTLAATVNDPDGDPLTVTWNFGDGTPNVAQTGVSNGPISVVHTYANNRNFNNFTGLYEAYPVTVTVSDGKAPPVSDTDSARIANVNPVVTALPATATLFLGQTYNLTVTYTDPGIEPGGWEYHIDWGDGSNTGTLTAPPPSGPPITESHVYAAGGCYTVNVKVREKLEVVGGGTTAVQVCLIVPVGVDIKPGSDPNSIRLSPKVQGNANIAVAIFGSATFAAGAVDVATITLGDGAGTDTPVMQRPNGTYYASTSDVNGDGWLDLVVHFERSALMVSGDLDEGTTQLCVNGGTFAAGNRFSGCDAVRPIP